MILARIIIVIYFFLGGEGGGWENLKEYYGQIKYFPLMIFTRVI